MYLAYPFWFQCQRGREIFLYQKDINLLLTKIIYLNMFNIE